MFYFPFLMTVSGGRCVSCGMQIHYLTLDAPRQVGGNRSWAARRNQHWRRKEEEGESWAKGQEQTQQRHRAPGQANHLASDLISNSI